MLSAPSTQHPTAQRRSRGPVLKEPPGFTHLTENKRSMGRLGFCSEFCFLSASSLFGERGALSFFSFPLPSLKVHTPQMHLLTPYCQGRHFIPDSPQPPCHNGTLGGSGCGARPGGAGDKLAWCVCFWRQVPVRCLQSGPCDMGTRNTTRIGLSHASQACCAQRGHSYLARVHAEWAPGNPSCSPSPSNGLCAQTGASS